MVDAIWQASFLLVARNTGELGAGEAEILRFVERWQIILNIAEVYLLQASC